MIPPPSTSNRSVRGFRWAFNTFAILFLLTITIGLLNYLGTVWKYR